MNKLYYEYKAQLRMYVCWYKLKQVLLLTMKIISINFYTFAVMTFAILHVSISSCVHFVMRDVTFGIIETLVMLPVPFSCLTMVPQCFLQLLWLFGVSLYKIYFVLSTNAMCTFFVCFKSLHCL